MKENFKLDDNIGGKRNYQALFNAGIYFYRSLYKMKTIIQLWNQCCFFFNFVM